MADCPWTLAQIQWVNYFLKKPVFNMTRDNGIGKLKDKNYLSKFLKQNSSIPSPNLALAKKMRPYR